MLRPHLILIIVSYSITIILPTDCADIRLVSNYSVCSGRVEIYSNGRWGTVCDDDWDMNDAKVVCRQMGCGEAVSAPGSARFGQGSDPILLNDVGCSGSESSLTQCSHPGFEKHNCNHGEDAGVECSASLAPFIGSGVCAGLLLILVPVIICLVKKCKEPKQITDRADHRRCPNSTEMCDAGDYENAETIFLESVDSEDYEQDYVNAEAHKENVSVVNIC